MIAIVGLVTHLFLAPYLMDQYGINGLVLSTALVTSLNLGLSEAILKFKVVSLPWKRVLFHNLKCTAAAAVMGGYLYYIQTLPWRQGRLLLDFPILLLIIAGAGVLYFGAAAVLKVEELNFVMKKLKR